MSITTRLKPHTSVDALIDALVCGDNPPAVENGLKRLIADIDSYEPYYRRPHGWVEQASLDGGHRQCVQ